MQDIADGILASRDRGERARVADLFQLSSAAYDQPAAPAEVDPECEEAL